MSSLLLIIFIILCILLALKYKNDRKKKRFWKLLENFYGGKTLPIIGNAHQYRNSEDFLWKSFELFKKAGHTTYKIIIGNTAIVCLCDPDTVEVMLSSTKEINKMREYKYFKDWLGDGLLISTGSKWRTRRKILTPTFHFKVLEQYVKVFNSNANILTQQLSKYKGQRVNIYPFISNFTLDVICEAAMGVSVNAQTDSDSKYVKAIQSMCKMLRVRAFSPMKDIPGYYFLTGNYFQYKSDLKILHDTTNNVIKTRKNILRDQIERVRNETTNDQDEYIKTRKKIAFLDLLILSKLPDGSFLSDEDIREETDTFMFEGHDTTSSGVSFAIFSLANNPDVQQKALEEVLSIVGDDPSKEMTYEHLQNMKYMDMIIKETLRLYPPVPTFARNLINDLTLPDGKVIPAGCEVMVDAFSLGRNPRHYPDHDKFIPERFSLENTSGKNPFQFVSFSAGSRNCIGQKFAVLELKCALAKILLNFELSKAADESELRLSSEIILKTITGVPVIVKERKIYK